MLGGCSGRCHVSSQQVGVLECPPYGGVATRAERAAPRHSDTIATVIRVRGTVGIRLVATVAAFTLLAACAADSNGDDIESLIDERIEAALAKQAANTTTTTQVAVNIGALIEEHIAADLDARPTWRQLSLQFACEDALDHFEWVVDSTRSAMPEDVTSLYPIYEDMSVPIWFETVLNLDGRTHWELEAKRVCDVAKQHNRLFQPFGVRHDRLQNEFGYLIKQWRDYCGGGQPENFAFRASLDRYQEMCEKSQARYRN